MTAPVEPSRTRRPAKALVIQLARLGDTLQSLMALRAAKQLYPELEIHFLARERFAAAARRVPWIEKVHTLPTDELLAPVLSGLKTESQAIPDIARWTRPLVSEAWDFVINWSYSEASSYLTGLLPARVKLGYSRRSDLTFSSEDGWSHYVQAIIQGKIQQNIHLTDILTTQLLTALQIHLGEPKEAGDAAVTSRDFFGIPLEDEILNSIPGWSDMSVRWAAVQLGASQEAKTWSTDQWTRFATSLLNRHDDYHLLLLGGTEDLGRANEILSALPDKLKARAASLAGRTDFDLWAGALARCQWLIAADTAAIHLASLLGIHVLNISVGPVRWSETGPYGNGHYVVTANCECKGCRTDSLEPTAHTCRDDVSAEAVYAAWAYGSSEWSHHRRHPLDQHFQDLGYSEQLQKVRVYRSRIRATEDGGGVTYDPLVRRAINTEDWLSQVLGHIARAWYCGWVPSIGLELSRETVGPDLIQALRQLDETANVLGKLCIEGRQTAVLLGRKTSRLKSDRLMVVQDRQDVQSLGAKLAEIDKLIDRLAHTHLAIVPFARMSKVLMHNLQSKSLTDLGQESAEAYQQINQAAQIIRDWTKHTLELARPVALSAGKVISLPTSRGKELPT